MKNEKHSMSGAAAPTLYQYSDTRGEAFVMYGLSPAEEQVEQKFRREARTRMYLERHGRMPTEAEINFIMGMKVVPQPAATKLAELKARHANAAVQPEG